MHRSDQHNVKMICTTACCEMPDHTGILFEYTVFMLNINIFVSGSLQSLS